MNNIAHVTMATVAPKPANLQHNTFPTLSIAPLYWPEPLQHHQLQAACAVFVLWRHDKRTAWTMDTVFSCKGMMWLMTTLMPGMFKKQTRATMSAFRDFAESKS